jgi:transcriptional regulator with XRE-family HTH domain
LCGVFMQQSLINIIRQSLEREMTRTGKRGKALSRAADLNEQAVRDLMSKVDDPKISTLIKLADALEVPTSMLFEQLVPIRGEIGAECRVVFFPEGQETGFQSRPRTHLKELEAFCVTGDYLQPTHFDGDVLFISREDDVPDEDCIGRECIVRLASGAGYLGKLEAGDTEGSFTLELCDGKVLRDIRPVWASLVFTVERSWHAERRNGSEENLDPTG